MTTPRSTSLRLGTRGSQLALAQARWVKAALEGAQSGLEVELVVIKTSGDRIQDRSLSEVGGKGLFIKEIEEALLRREVDVAVHSMKDLPSELAPGLEIAAVPEREDPGDVLIAPGRDSIAALARGARVGTSSLRRMALLRAERPDLEVVPLRGNVDTRLRRLDEGVVDAIVLAAAGLRRLGLSPAAAVPLDVRRFVPAIGQGALAIEARVGEHREFFLRLDHAATHAAVAAERAFMRGVHGSCTTPLAAYARAGAAGIEMNAVIASPDGARAVRGSTAGETAEAEHLGEGLARELMARGGAEILRALGAIP
jgi:hydroxymethylbilane synthase